MNNAAANNTNARRNRRELKQWLNIEEITFNKIYVNAVPLEGGAEVYGYIRDWKNGEVGYSVLDYASDSPDFSNCGVFWMKPEDFGKVFMIYREMKTDGSDKAGPGKGISANKETIFEFRERIKEAVMNAVPENMKEDLTLEDAQVIKINDQKLFGLTFHIRKALSSPTFYLNDCYENYIHGASIDNMVKQLVDSFLFSVNGLSAETENQLQKDVEVGLDDLRGRIAVKVLEIGRNQEYLKTVPFKDIGYGFAMVFDVQNVIDGRDVWRMPVTNDMLEKSDMDVNDLYASAIEFVNEVDPAILVSSDRQSSGKKIKNLLENDKPIKKGRPVMYLLTNRLGKYGAATFFYPGMKKRIADRIDDSYYAIPSSIHEFIIVPGSSGADIASLCDKLKLDNYSTVHQEEVLSDNVFFYDKAGCQLMCINELLGANGGQC